MFKSLPAILSLSVAIFNSLAPTVAQTSNATCEPQFDWTENSRQQTPCIVAAYLMGACLNGQWNVVAIDNTSLTYLGPSATQASVCTCSSVSFSLISACAYCQGAVLPLWSDWTSNCGTAEISSGVYPHAIPPGTAVPGWAYTSVITTWDPNQALTIHNDGNPESVAPGASSTATSSLASTASSTATSSSSSSSASPTTPAPAPTSNKKSSNTGAIVGGVVGGIAALAIIGLLAFFFLRKKPGNTSALGAQHANFQSGAEKLPLAPGFTSPSPGFPPPSVSPGMPGTPMKLYNPNDPSTFPSAGGGEFGQPLGYNNTEAIPQPYYPEATPSPNPFGGNGMPVHPNLPQV